MEVEGGFGGACLGAIQVRSRTTRKRPWSTGTGGMSPPVRPTDEAASRSSPRAVAMVCGTKENRAAGIAWRCRDTSSAYVESSASWHTPGFVAAKGATNTAPAAFTLTGGACAVAGPPPIR